MKKLYILLGLLMLSTLPALAQWSSRGPNGGFAYSFYQDGPRIWVATGGGVYFTTDDGLTWQSPALKPADFSCNPVRSVAASGLELYAGTTSAGVFHSIDGGGSWTATNTNLRTGSAYTDVEITGSVGFALRSDSGLVYRTPDRGVSWLLVSGIGTGRALYLSQYSGTDLYVTTLTGLYKSTDGGTSFSLVNNNPQDMGRPYWVDDTLYVAVNGVGIKKSTDFGVSFVPLGLSGRTVNAVAAAGGNLYAVLFRPSPPDSVLYSADNGVSFGAGAYSSASMDPGRIADVTAHGSTALLATMNGIFRSTNRGALWSRADSGLHATQVYDLSLSGTNLYAAARPMGIYFSPDSTTSWRAVGDMASGIKGNGINAVKVKNQYVHAGGIDYHRSTNFGSTWTTGAPGLPSSISTQSIYAAPGTRTVLTVMGGVLYSSGDDGVSFAIDTVGLPAGASYVTMVDTAIFVSAQGGLYRAGGDHVFAATSGTAGPITSVTFMDSLYYAGSATNGLFTSHDGSTWVPMPLPFPFAASSLHISTLLADSGRILAGTDNGILRFQPMTGTQVPTITIEGLQGHTIFSLAALRNHLFAGTCNGVWSDAYDAPPAGTGNVPGKATAEAMVFPNPTGGDFSIRISSAQHGAGRVVLKNMLGATVLQQACTLSAGNNTIAVHTQGLGLPAGIYIVQVSRPDGQQQTGRIIVR